MRVLLVSIGISMALGCGGRVDTASDGGSGAGTSTGGSGGSTVGETGGTSGTTVGGTGGTTVGGQGGTAVGGAGGAGGTIGGTGGSGTVPTDYRTCTGPGECELTPTSCCACGVLGLDELSAINTSKRAEFKRWSCGPAPEACPPCVGTIDPYLLARCETGICSGFDVRTDPNFTKCLIDTDCMLRAGLGCCECNTTNEWVAISKVGAMTLTPQVCGPNSVCPKCVPTPPAGYAAVCRSGACLKLVATP